MSRNFTGHNPKPARVTRTGAAPGRATQAAAPAPTPSGEPAGNIGKPKEIGGPSGLEPTRYGDWERNGICVDF